MTKEEIKALRERRQKLIEDARKLHETGTDDAPLSGEDDAKVKKMLEDARAIGQQIEREEALEAEERVFTLPETQRRTERRDDTPPDEKEQRDRYSAAMRSYLRHGFGELSGDEQKILRVGYEQFETRDMSTLSGAAGGYTVYPDTRFAGQIIEALKFYGGVEAAGAEVFQTDTGADLPLTTDDDTSNVGTIIPEEGSHAGGTSPTVGQKVLRAYLYSSKVIKVSWQLLQDSAVDIEEYVGRKFGTRLGRILNTHFTVGTGANQPEGVVPNTAQGRQAVAGNTTSIPADDIKRLEHSVDIAYRNMGARYMMNDSTALAIRLLKDGQGRYLWQDGLQAGQPAMLNGYPVTINNDMAAMAASAKSVLFGQFFNYKIRRVRAMQVVRLGELYVENGQVGFLAFLRADGGLVDAGQNPIKHFANSAT